MIVYYVCCENCMSGFSAFALFSGQEYQIWQYFVYRSMANGNCLFSSASLSLEEITDWCIRMMEAVGWATCKCNMPNILHWKSRQSIVGGKLFSSYWTVFELAQSSRLQSKWLKFLVRCSCPERSIYDMSR